MVPTTFHPGSWQLAHLPLTFPSSSRILYRAFRPINTHARPELALEQGRRKIVQHWRPGVGTIDVPLAVVDHVKQVLWTFAIASGNSETIPSVTLHSLSLDGLIEEVFDSYRPLDVYPCSEACSSMPRPCVNCPPTWNIRDYMSSACLLPRMSLRSAHAHFLLAVRDHIVDSLCISSLKSSNTLQKIPGGFVFRGSRMLGEWGSGWNELLDMRPLKASMVHLHLTSTGILVQLVMKGSSFRETRSKMEPGTPLVLLPFLTPAYYVGDVPADEDMEFAFRTELSGHGYSSTSNSGFYQCWMPREGDKDANTPSSSRSEQNIESHGVLLLWPKSMCLVSSTRPPAHRVPSSSSISSPKGKHPQSSKNRVATQRSVSTLRYSMERIATHANEFVNAVVKERERARDMQRSNDPKPTNSPIIESPSPKANLIAQNPRSVAQTYPSPPGLSPGPSYHQANWHASSPLQFSSFSPFTTFGLDSPNMITASASSANLNPLFSQMQNPQSSFPTPSSFNSTTATTQNQSSYPTIESFMDAGLSTIGDITWSGVSFPSGDDPPEHTNELRTDMVDLKGILDDARMLYFDPSVDLQVLPQEDSPRLEDEVQWTKDIALTPQAPGQSAAAHIIDAPVVLTTSLSCPSSPSSPIPDYKPVRWQRGVSSISPDPIVSGVDTFAALDFPGSLSMNARTREAIFGQHRQYPPPVAGHLSSGFDDTCIPIDTTVESFYDSLSNPRSRLMNRIKRRILSSDGSRRSGDDDNLGWREVDQMDDNGVPSDETDSDASLEEGAHSAEDEQMDADGPATKSMDEGSPVVVALLVLLDRAVLESLSRPFRTWPTAFGTLVSSVDQDPRLNTEHQEQIPIVSVPTPISPGVITTSAVQRDYRMDAMEFMIRECAENERWFRCFKAYASPEHDGLLQEWPQELVPVIQCLQRDLGFGMPLDLSSLGTVSVKDVHMRTRTMSLDDPLLALGRGDSVIQVLPSALRFWEKIGLSPLSGKKDVVCYALYEPNESDANIEAFIAPWLERISQVYVARNLGNHTVGSSWHSKGLVPLRWANYKRTLATFLANLEESAHVVLYLIAPPPFLLADFIGYVGLSRVLKKHVLVGERVLVHVVPLETIFDYSQSAKHGSMADIASAVYDRLNRRVDRMVCPKEYQVVSDRYTWVRAPSFSISRASTPAFKFALEWPPHAMDVTDRYLLFHVGYKWSRDRDWLFAACVDQRGHGHQTRHWYTGHISAETTFETLVAENILNFALECSRRAQVEWRSVIAKMGFMSIGEIEAWELCLATKASQDAAANGPLNFEILSVEDGSFTFLSSKGFNQFAATKPVEDSTTLFADGSSSTFAVFPGLRLRFVSPVFQTFGTDLSDDAPSFRASLTKEVDSINLLPICSSYLVHVPRNPPLAATPIGSGSARACVSVVQLSTLLIWKSANSTLGTWKRSISDLQRDWACSFHELAVLAKLRWGFRDWGPLPYHLVAVEVMCSVVDSQQDIKVAQNERFT